MIESFCHRIRDRHCVRIRSAVDGCLDAFSPVDAGYDLSLLVPPVNIGDATKRYLDIIAPLDDDVFDLLDFDELIDRPNQILAVFLLEYPGRKIDILLGQTGCHCGDRNIQQAELLLVEVDMDLVFQSSGNGTCGNTFDRLQRLFDLSLGDITDAGKVCVAGYSQLHDRLLIGIVPEDDGFRGTDREPEKVQLLPELQRGEIHVGVPGKLDRDFRKLCPGDRRYANDVVHNAAGLFDGFGDDVLDLGRRSSRIFGLDGQSGVGDLREEVQA